MSNDMPQGPSSPYLPTSSHAERDPLTPLVVPTAVRTSIVGLEGHPMGMVVITQPNGQMTILGDAKAIKQMGEQIIALSMKVKTAPIMPGGMISG